MPGADEPDVVAAYEADLAAETVRFERPEDPFAEGTGFAAGGDRTSLRLRPEDEALIAETVAVNPRTVVVLVAGSAVDVTPWHLDVPAIAQAWYGGMESGHALAAVLVGASEPVGRLPFSMAEDPAHLPPFDAEADAVVYDAWHGYWRLERDGRTPAYPFGFGLSYTTLAIDDATVVIDGDALVATATAANGGDRPGVEVVQVYAAGGDGPMRLRGFARVELAAGERRAVEVRVPLSSLARRRAGRWAPVEGPLRWRVARHGADPGASGQLELA
jgi:beta-glucosidase